MAKKKSKTQKYKKNLKEKQKKEQKKILERTEELKRLKESQVVVANKTKKIDINKTTNKTKTKTNATKNKNKTDIAPSKTISEIEKPKKKLVEKNKVEYNIPITKSTKKTKPKNNSRKLIEKDSVLYNVPLKNKQIDEDEKQKKVIKVKKKKSINYKHILLAIFSSIALFFKKIFTGLKNAFINIRKLIIKNKAKKTLNKSINIKKNIKYKIIEEDQDDEELSKDELRELKRKKQKEEIKKKNIFIRLIYEIFSNRHIFFNAVLILFFIVLLIGLKRIEVVSTGSIIYVSIILIFLMAVAISYNRYFSGKLFTILLCVGMGFAIYRMQYTYDFIRNLNTNVYEYKTYYVVTFNNNQNKSIYNINNKKVGLYNDNTINIERKLNTKLDKVHYIEYDNLNDLFDDFYNQNFRAILVNENQYKYMKNYITENSREVKILYEFRVNAKK